jgi:hypothetical protein
MYLVITFATGIGIAWSNVKRYIKLLGIAISNFFTLADRGAKPKRVIARSMSDVHAGVPAFVPQGGSSRRQALRHAGMVSCVAG